MPTVLLIYWRNSKIDWFRKHLNCSYDKFGTFSTWTHCQIRGRPTCWSVNSNVLSPKELSCCVADKWFQCRQNAVVWHGRQWRILTVVRQIGQFGMWPHRRNWHNEPDDLAVDIIVRFGPNWCLFWKSMKVRSADTMSFMTSSFSLLGIERLD